jgi:transketolase
MDAAAVLALAGQGEAILAVEDTYIGGIGSELAEAAAATAGAPQVRSLAVHRIPKSGRTPDDVLAYVHLSVSDIVDAAGELAGRQPARSAVLVAAHGK